MAFVNNNINTTGYPSQSQFITQFRHLFFARNTILGAPMLLGMSDPHPDVSGYWGSTASLWKENVFQWIGISDPLLVADIRPNLYCEASEGTLFTDNHFVHGWPDYIGLAGTPYGAVLLGTGVTTGETPPATRGAAASWDP
jgi:hypothetical protein